MDDNAGFLGAIADAGFSQDVMLQLALPWHSAILQWGYFAGGVLLMLGALIMVYKKTSNPQFTSYPQYLVWLIIVGFIAFPVPFNAGDDVFWHAPPGDDVRAVGTDREVNVALGVAFFIWATNRLESTLYDAARVGAAAAYGIPRSEVQGGFNENAADSYRAPAWALSVTSDGAGPVALGNPDLTKINYDYRSYCQSIRDGVSTSVVPEEEWAKVGLAGNALVGLNSFAGEIQRESSRVAGVFGDLGRLLDVGWNRLRGGVTRSGVTRPTNALRVLSETNISGCTGDDCKIERFMYQIPSAAKWQFELATQGESMAMPIGPGTNTRVASFDVNNEYAGSPYLELDSDAARSIRQLNAGDNPRPMGAHEASVSGSAGFVDYRDVALERTKYYANTCGDLYAIASVANDEFFKAIKRDTLSITDRLGDFYGSQNMLGIGLSMVAQRQNRSASAFGDGLDLKRRQAGEAGEGFTDQFGRAIKDTAAALGLATSTFFADLKLPYIIMGAIGAAAMIVAVIIVLMPFTFAYSLIPGKESALVVGFLAILWAKMTLFVQYLFLSLGVFGNNVLMFVDGMRDSYGEGGISRLSSLMFVFEYGVLVAVAIIAPLVSYMLIFSETRGLGGVNAASGIMSGVSSGLRTIAAATAGAFGAARAAGIGSAAAGAGSAGGAAGQQVAKPSTAPGSGGMVQQKVKTSTTTSDGQTLTSTSDVSFKADTEAGAISALRSLGGGSTFKPDSQQTGSQGETGGKNAGAPQKADAGSQKKA